MKLESVAVRIPEGDKELAPLHADGWLLALALAAGCAALSVVARPERVLPAAARSRKARHVSWIAKQGRSRA